MSKPTYKISPSLLNSYIYYLNNPEKKNYDSLVNRLNNIFETNIYLERGLKFEDEVFEGKHGKLSELVKDLQQQVWANKTIERDEYNIKISGRLDVYDPDKKRIYDIKRVSRFTPNKYDDSTQHLLYFYTMPEAKEFYYLVAVGPDEKIVNEVALYKRPDDAVLEETVIHVINNFYQFLKQKNLWEVYTENQKTKVYTNSQEETNV